MLLQVRAKAKKGPIQRGWTGVQTGDFWVQWLRHAWRHNLDPGDVDEGLVCGCGGQQIVQ